MEDWSGRKVFAEYASFRLEPESEYYKLRLGRYNGNAGDSFTWHNGKQFTTLDRDHDVYTGTQTFKYCSLESTTRKDYVVIGSAIFFIKNEINK